MVRTWARSRVLSALLAIPCTFSTVSPAWALAPLRDTVSTRQTRGSQTEQELATLFGAPAAGLPPAPAVNPQQQEVQHQHETRLAEARRLIQDPPWILKVERGYDVRGDTDGPNTTMTPAFAYALGVGTALTLRDQLAARGIMRRPRMALTGDHRMSTPALQRAWVEGLERFGVDVFPSDEAVSTPASNVVPRLAEPGTDHAYDGAGQVTASHNPWTWEEHTGAPPTAPQNGFKLSLADDTGELRGVYGQEVASLLRRSLQPDAARVLPADQWGHVEPLQILPAYIDHFVRVAHEALAAEGLTPEALKDVVLVFDTGNGVAGPIACAVVERLGMTYVGLHDEVITDPHGHTVHHADPSQRGLYTDHFPQAVARVAAEHSDKLVLGVSLDGDGDRVDFTNAGGTILLEPNQVAYLFVDRLLEEDPSAPVVLDYRVGQEVVDLVQRTQGAVHRWLPPGWPIVRRGMQEEGASLGVEAALHVFRRTIPRATADPIDDGLWVGFSAVLMELALRKQGSSIAKRLDRPWYPGLPEEFRPMVDETIQRKYDVMPLIAQGVSEEVARRFTGARIQQILSNPKEEGAARLQISDANGQFMGWVLLRASNTGPQLSLLLQGRTIELRNQLADISREVLQRFPAVDQALVRTVLGPLSPGSAPQLMRQEEGAVRREAKAAPSRIATVRSEDYEHRAVLVYDDGRKTEFVRIRGRGKVLKVVVSENRHAVAVAYRHEPRSGLGVKAMLADGRTAMFTTRFPGVGRRWRTPEMTLSANGQGVAVAFRRQAVSVHGDRASVMLAGETRSSALIRDVRITLPPVMDPDGRAVTTAYEQPGSDGLNVSNVILRVRGQPSRTVLTEAEAAQIEAIEAVAWRSDRNAFEVQYRLRGQSEPLRQLIPIELSSTPSAPILVAGGAATQQAGEPLGVVEPTSIATALQPVTRHELETFIEAFNARLRAAVQTRVDRGETQQGRVSECSVYLTTALPGGPMVSITHAGATADETRPGVDREWTVIQASDEASGNQILQHVLSHPHQLEPVVYEGFLTFAAARAGGRGPAIQGFEVVVGTDSRNKKTIFTAIPGAENFGDPAGKSTGRGEATKADVAVATQHIADISAQVTRQGIGVHEQARLDALLMDRQAVNDGEYTQGKWAGNATLGVSIATLKASAHAKDMELYQRMQEDRPALARTHGRAAMAFNIFNGGEHALKGDETHDALGVTRIDGQEIMVTASSQRTYRQQLALGDAIKRALGTLLAERIPGFDPLDPNNIGDEGGFAPRGIGDMDVAIDLVDDAAQRAGFQPGVDYFLSIDMAGTTLRQTDGSYRFKNQLTDAQGIIDWAAQLKARKQHVVLIEDLLGEDDIEGWRAATEQLANDADLTDEELQNLSTLWHSGKLAERMVLVLDDFSVTQATRLRTLGFANDIGTGLLDKLNQNGTWTGAAEAMQTAVDGYTAADGRRRRYVNMVSHRSGETTDTTIGHMAHGLKVLMIKTGAPSQGPTIPTTEAEGRLDPRRAKYLEMIDLEEGTGAIPPYTGAGETVIHVALQEATRLRDEGQLAEARKRTLELIEKLDIAIAMLDRKDLSNTEYEAILTGLNQRLLERFGRGSSSDLISEAVLGSELPLFLFQAKALLSSIDGTVSMAATDDAASPVSRGPDAPVRELGEDGAMVEPMGIDLEPAVETTAISIDALAAKILEGSP